jgi:DNA-binding MarR family transcriptional regulator/GNAT superfamily N-acetyltransferase
MARTFSGLDSSVQAVRRFNRFYTQQIGVLQEHLLRSQFSLTEVRVLYELAHREQVTAGELCRELGLDRGYLSRMLQAFQKQGWIKTVPSPADRRRIFLSLTRKGQAAFSPLDRRSSDEVGAMLTRLSAAQCGSLLGAMAEIESILSPAESRPLPEHSRSSATAPPAYLLRSHKPGDMGWVVQRHGELYSREYGYDERFEALVAGIVAKFIEQFDAKRERCWIAEKDGERVGSIFLVRKSSSVAKLRLLLVEPGARGLGIGRRLVSECVNFARHAGYRKIVLWTQSELPAARHLYEQAGFRRIRQKPHQSWGRKDLVSEIWELKL